MPLGTGEKFVRPVPVERRGVVEEAMPAPPLVILEVENSLFEEGPIGEAAVRHV